MAGLSNYTTDPNDFSNKYNTTLTPEQEIAFMQWANNMSKKYNRDILKDLYDYDMRGAFTEGLTPDGNLHWNDRYKKPNHPTFSVYSKYNGIDGYFGGNWMQMGDNRFIYVPSSTNTYSKEALSDYMRQVEPNNILLDNRKE